MDAPVWVIVSAMWRMGFQTLSGGALCALALALTGAVAPRAAASESDQFMLWGRELEDGGPALNAYLTREFDIFLEEINSKPKYLDKDPAEITVKWYRHIFRHLLYGKIRGYFRNSGEVEAYPPRGGEIGMLKYQQMSIFRSRKPFPYILPMSRTVRMGDIYCGTDKISHMLGYGRRYFVRYHILRKKKGLSDREAKERVIRWGLWSEKSVVGRFTDGVVSYGDLEANYQGLLFGLDIYSGDDPALGFEDGQWVRLRDIDIVKYVTPDMDESYNTAYYWLNRKKTVLPVLMEEYVPRLNDPEVQERFALYDTYPKSLNMQLLEQWLAEADHNPKEAQSLPALWEKKYGVPYERGVPPPTEAD